VLFTFDDGYRSVYALARPLLERYAIPAVVFACSDAIADRRLLWYDAVARAAGEPAVAAMKQLPYDAWRAAAGAVPRAAAEGDPEEPLRVDELQALARVPGVEIGAHTAEHPILARAPLDEQRAEIERDSDRLAAWLGAPPRAFAYPNGRPHLDYDDDTVRLVGEAGFDFAFTTRERFAAASEPPLERSRFVVLAGLGAAELAHRLCYSWRRR
jgi:peptidoglycan/xylan/chitin deacetylase (PgdA/CDA1 family)